MDFKSSSVKVFAARAEPRRERNPSEEWHENSRLIRLSVIYISPDICWSSMERSDMPMIQIHISSFIFSVSRASEENFSRGKEERHFIRRAILLDQAAQLRTWQKRIESTKFMKHKCEFCLIGTWQRSEENPERILLFILSRVFWTKLYRILKQILFIQWTTLKPESNQICSRILIHSLKVLEESGSWLILARFHQDWSGMRLGLFRCLASVCQCPPYSACLITLGRCFTAASNRRICLFSLLSKQVDEASVSSFLMFVNSFSLISFNGLISFTRSNFVKISVGRYAQ